MKTTSKNLATPALGAHPTAVDSKHSAPNMSSSTRSRIQRWMVASLSIAGLSACLTSCASYGVIKNEPITEASSSTQPYSIKTWASTDSSDDIIFVVAFSGGGTRASAMAYGVLEELRNTQIDNGAHQKRLLDEVDYISSVSGGSFTAAYYGLYGEKLFTHFEDEFLRKNVEGHLTKGLFNPFHWFGSKGRTERAIDYYEKNLFHNATFADMHKPDRPMVVINASDLAQGVRFSFIQDYFDFLGSDLSTFPVARAVAASSAVPVVFNPVVVENYPDTSSQQYQWPPNAKEKAKQDPNFRMLYQGLQSYNDKDARQFIHFVDGGITDNTGMRAMSDIIDISGGPGTLIKRNQRKLPKHVVFLLVNASTQAASSMDDSTKQPSMLTAMNAATNVQLHRYNTASTELAKNQLYQSAKVLSSPGHSITPHFIEVDFQDIPQPSLKVFLNKIPTSFSLNDEQVDTLIKSARSLLRENPNYQKLLKDIR
ncbi:patatin-like phospholipase family protein [Rubritalea sp.]|uniref:patatin-like phospholipase family protein n=1 Tax=Rubritalea sp. TaxID=2109375 RepID=UPI003EF643F9